MAVKASYSKHCLKFKFPAGTSRGVLNEKDTYYLILEEDGVKGIGECSTIPGLSLDHIPKYEEKIQEVCELINLGEDNLNPVIERYPSIRFGIETARMDLEKGGNKIIFPGDFTSGRKGIPINGLIWMGDKKFMLDQIAEKLDAGYRCLKLKVGALNFGSEVAMLKNIRKEFSSDELELRLDANGAFTKENAFDKLDVLSEFDIHSIEQPIKKGQYEHMEKICISSPIPIAFDEELIGHFTKGDKMALLFKLSPAYIVVKPSLLGGIKDTMEWVEVAERFKIKWWATSALESNIGLSVIAQWVSSLNTDMVQGLGTGSLYENNIQSPLNINKSSLFYDPEKCWSLNGIF